MLLGVCLGGVITEAGAYEVPEGYEIKTVYIGTLSDDGTTVMPEDFENMTALDSKWSANTINSISIGEVTEVAKPEVGSAPEGVPTYVSGKTFQGYLRKGGKGWDNLFFASYTFDAISTGKLVFSADMFSTENVAGPVILKFVDSDGNDVFQLSYPYGSGNQSFKYTLADGTSATIGASSNYRSYPGYAIKDLVVDFASGDVTFTFDYINTGGNRSQKEASFNIGTGKNIQKLLIGKGGISSTNLYFHIDNIELYTVGLVSGTYNYTVNAVAGETVLQQVATGICKGGVPYSVTSLQKVIKSEDKYYILDDEAVADYSKTFTMGDADETTTVNYKYDESIAYFGEWETAVSNSTNYKVVENSAMSGGKGRTINKTSSTISITFTVDGAGEYKFSIPYNNTNSKARTHIISIDDTEVETKSVSANTAGEFNYTTELSAGEHTLSIKCNYSLTAIFDYLLVTKSSPQSDIVTVSSAGYATYAPTMSVTIPDGVEVYAVALNGSNITTTLLDASTVLGYGQGYLLKAAEGTYAFVSTTDEATTVENNDMKAATSDVTATGTQYALANKSAGVGFYEVNTDVVIPAGKAYLEYSGELGSAKAYYLLGEATAISTIATDAKTSDCYNLQGQKVSKPVKGLYIVGGRKVVVR